MIMTVNNNIPFVMLYNYLKAHFGTVEVYQNIEKLETNSDYSLAIWHCEKQTYASFAILINNNKELVLELSINNGVIDKIYTDTIDAAIIANDAIEAMLEQAKYYGEDDFYPEREEDNEEYADETYTHDFNA